MVSARGKKGFTLIELLVVITIIVMLAAILFPVFSQAREAARQSVCLSNVRQITVAALMYVNDWDEVLMPAAHWSACRVANRTPGYPCYNQGQTACENMGYPCSSPPQLWGAGYDIWYDFLFPYYRNKDLLTCPQRPEFYQLGYAINDAYGSTREEGCDDPPTEDNPWPMAICQMMQGGGPGWYPIAQDVEGMRMADVQNPANCIWFADSNPALMEDLQGDYEIAVWGYFDEGSGGAPRGKTTCLAVLENYIGDEGWTEGELILSTGAGWWFQDGCQLQVVLNQGSPLAPIADPTRHRGGMNMGFVDGHAKYARNDRITNSMFTMRRDPD